MSVCLSVCACVCITGLDVLRVPVCQAVDVNEVTAMTEDGAGGGSGPVYMSDVRCSYGDDTLFQCDSIWKNASSSCRTHSKDAAVSCFKESKNHHHRVVVIIIIINVFVFIIIITVFI